MDFDEHWDQESEDDYLPTPESESKEKAVFIGQQTTGTTLMIGCEENEEWLSTSNMVALPLEKYR